METQFRTEIIPGRYKVITATAAVSPAAQQKNAPGTLDTEIFAALWQTLRTFPEARAAVREKLNEVLVRHGDTRTSRSPQ